MLRWLWLSLGVLVLDQLSKRAAAEQLRLHEAEPVLPFFSLTLAHNRGAAFSFLSDQSGWQRWLFIALAGVVSLGLVIWMSRLRRGERLVAVSFALILGGAVGNLIDRVAHGYVIDFLLLHYQRWYWPAFNLADSAITVGAALLVIDALFLRRSSS